MTSEMVALVVALSVLVLVVNSHTAASAVFLLMVVSVEVAILAMGLAMELAMGLAMGIVVILVQVVLHATALDCWLQVFEREFSYRGNSQVHPQSWWLHD